MPRLTLAIRTFLLSFVPICLLLVGLFTAIDSAVHERVRRDLRDGLYNSDQLLNRANAEFSHENSALLAKLTDSAGLKASVGLLPEAQKDASLQKQVHATIEAQLYEFQRASPYDYLSISDLRGKIVVAIPDSAVFTKDGSAVSVRDGLADIGGILFQFQSVPIEIGGETAGTLTVGRRFDLKRIAGGDDFALSSKGRIVRSTFPAAVMLSLDEQLQKHCVGAERECTVETAGKSYVVSSLQREQVGDEFNLLVFRSLDAPLDAFNHAFLPKLIEIALSGIIVALICTLITTRSVVHPLRLLASQLETGADSGTLPERLDVGNSVREVDLVATAFNRVAAAEGRSRRELMVAKQAAEMANRLKSEFLNNISHELRTPINGVLGMTQLLVSTGLSAEQAEYADTICDSATALVALIDGILDFSELETGRVRLKLGVIDLPEMLEDVTSAMRARVAKKPVAIEVSKSPSLPGQCIGEDKRIRQVLMHLCENAIKFTESGFIRVLAQYTPATRVYGNLTFSVEDSGIGIAAEDLQFVFQPFTQVDGSLTRRHGGTGIGLSITKGLVELMGGQIGVRSNPGVGSTFWFTVPTELTGKLQKPSESQEFVNAT